MVLAIFLSHSRSGMVSIIAVCVMYLCVRFVHGRWWRYLLSVSITGLLIIGSYWLKKRFGGWSIVDLAVWLGDSERRSLDRAWYRKFRG